MLVISRNRLKNFYGYSDIVEAKKILTAGYNIDEILTYDDLLDRAKEVYSRLLEITKR